MIRNILSLAAALTVAGSVSFAACSVPANSGAMQTELMANLNAERKSHGLSPLKLDPSLDKAAQGHACDNAKRHSTSHVSGDGSHLQNRLRRVGYDYKTAAENTGRGFASGKRAIEWWMDSPGHKKNILLRNVSDVGVGIAMSDAPDSRLHWILVMGKSH